jgi:prophage DNA circulation protein
MTDILKLASGIAWRARLMPAMFRNARFHVDAGVRESARRIVPHEFPKRDVPYAEDMGRRAREFTVRAYIIVYPRNSGTNDLQQKNYIPARDRLITALEEEGPAVLQLPLLGVLNVACSRYRITEDDRTGGYCVFDMTFVEFGQAPAEGTRQSAAGVYYAATQINSVTKSAIAAGIKKISQGSGVSA